MSFLRLLCTTQIDENYSPRGALDYRKWKVVQNPKRHYFVGDKDNKLFNFGIEDTESVKFNVKIEA